MKNVIIYGKRFYLFFCVFSLFYLSAVSMVSPQNTMDLVDVKLTNNDAISSIRGIYGGVGLTLTLSLIYLFVKKQLDKAVMFLTLFWFSYFISRIITILIDGELGDFGNQWIMIEFVLFALGGGLLISSKSNSKD